MPSYFLLAAILVFAIGVIHSILGEWLIFKKLRAGGLVPRAAAPPLSARHIHILWATWHLASVFGFGLSAVLVLFSVNEHLAHPVLLNILVSVFLVAGALVLVATRGKHLGWVGLLGVAVLILLGRGM